MMKSLKKALVFLTFAAASGALAAEPSAPGLPTPAPDTAMLLQRCAPLADTQVEKWGDADRWQILYIWRSVSDVAFDLMPEKNYRTEQYCTRLRLLRADSSSIDTITVLCAVANRNTPTEVWTFGNHAPATTMCALKSGAAAAIDTMAPLVEHPVLSAAKRRPPADLRANQAVVPHNGK